MSNDLMPKLETLFNFYISLPFVFVFSFLFFSFFYQSRSNLMQKINSVLLLIYMYVAFPFIRFKYSMQQNQKQIIAEKIENDFSEISRFEIGCSYVLYHFVMIQLVCVFNGQKVKRNIVLRNFGPTLF